MKLAHHVIGLALALLLSAKGEAVDWSQWSGSTSASYSSDLTGDAPTSAFSLRLSQSLSENWSVSLSQSVGKKFYIYPNEDEFSLSDTVLSSTNSLGESYGLNHSFSLGITFPISENSRDNNKYTNLRLALGSSHQVLEDRLSLSYGLSSTGYLSEYQSEISNDGLGGTALPIASLGLSHGGSYTLSDSLSANYSLAYTRVWYYELDPEVTSALLSVSDVPNDLFNASVGIGYALGKGLGLGAGFSKGNLVTQVGTLDLAIFDEDLSQYYLSLSWSFSQKTFSSEE